MLLRLQHQRDTPASKTSRLAHSVTPTPAKPDILPSDPQAAPPKPLHNASAVNMLTSELAALASSPVAQLDDCRAFSPMRLRSKALMASAKPQQSANTEEPQSEADRSQHHRQTSESSGQACADYMQGMHLDSGECCGRFLLIARAQDRGCHKLAARY